MPIYTYQIVNPDGSDGETFEVMLSMSDPPLRKHPQTGQPVRRVFQPPNISGQYSEATQKRNMSDSNLERLGFTKYQRVGKGQYEQRTGHDPRAPKTIDARD